MTRVPTRTGSLQTAVPARDSRLRIVYSPEEALDEARRDPAREVVFFGAGFETTIPAIAYTAKRAAAEGLRNFSVLPALWLVPPALRAVLDAGEAAVDGFIYPGHVSAVIGAGPYEFVARDHGIPGAIAGFEPGDILLAVRSVLEQAVEGKPARRQRILAGHRAATGNPVARALMDEVFEPFDAVWRGLGPDPGERPALPEGLRRRSTPGRGSGSGRPTRAGTCPAAGAARSSAGVIRPEGCRLFGKKCRPDSPLGPCMVSLRRGLPHPLQVRPPGEARVMSGKKISLDLGGGGRLMRRVHRRRRSCPPSAIPFSASSPTPSTCRAASPSRPTATSSIPSSSPAATSAGWPSTGRSTTSSCRAPSRGSSPWP